MKKIIVALILTCSIFFAGIKSVDAVVNVKGYVRSNGTHVKSHVRSNPNGLKSDNYSYTSSQNPYNATYGTRGAYWDTPTYITDPDYYVGKAIYDQGKTNSNSTSYSSSVSNAYSYSAPANLPMNNVSYVTKLWDDNNPNTACSQATFLRNAEKVECQTYRLFKNNYKWNVTTTEFDNKRYVYNPTTNSTTSCPDGYSHQFDAKGKVMSGCVLDTTPVVQGLPAGCTSLIGFSATTGQSCSVNNTGCVKGAKFSTTTGLLCPSL